MRITVSEDAGDEGLYHVLNKHLGSAFRFKLKDGSDREGLLVSAQFNDAQEYDDQDEQVLTVTLGWWSEPKGDYEDAHEVVNVADIEEAEYL